MSPAQAKGHNDKNNYVLYDIETKSFLASVLSSIQGAGNLVEDDGEMARVITRQRWRFRFRL